MPAVFKKELFHFPDDESILDHIDDYPSNHPIEVSRHHIEGYIPEDGDFVWLAINLDEDAAERMLNAAIKRQREVGHSRFGIALVRPNMEGAYASIQNILPADDLLV